MGRKEWVEQKQRDELDLIKRVASQTRNAVVTGPAGARWHGLATLDWVGSVDLVMPGYSKAWGKARQYPDRVYRSGSITDEDFKEKDGVRVASMIRCIFDTMRYHGWLAALVQLESARAKWQSLTIDELLHRTSSLPRAHGLRKFRRLIEYSAATSESVLETLMRHEILQAIDDGRLTGVNTLDFQVTFPITGADGNPTTPRVDVVINGELLVEADGALKSDGTFGDPLASTSAERHREKQLLNLGHPINRFGWDEVTSRSFLQVLQRAINALAARAA